MEVICSQVKVAKKATCSKMLRRVHLCELKNTSSKIVICVCYLTVNYLDKEGVLCGTGIFYCHRCCIAVHKKCVRDYGWVRDDNLFLVMNV